MSAGDLAGDTMQETPGTSCKGVCPVGVEEHKKILLSKEMQWYLPFINLILSKTFTNKIFITDNLYNFLRNCLMNRNPLEIFRKFL